MQQATACDAVAYLRILYVQKGGINFVSRAKKAKNG